MASLTQVLYLIVLGLAIACMVVFLLGSCA